MIKIENPCVIDHDDDKVRIIANLGIDGKIKELWFECDKPYEADLTPEVSDGFIIASLQYAMRNRHDITFAAPVSAEFLYNLRTFCFSPFILF